MPEAVAWAISAIGTYIGGAGGATLIMYATEIAYGVIAATMVAVSADQQRSAENKARSAYNRSQKDRYLMTRGSMEPRRLVLGQRRVSGPMAYVGSYGTDREHLVFVVAIAAHVLSAGE